MPKEILHVCTDKIVPSNRQSEAAGRARVERQGNSPDPTLLGDALERLGALVPDLDAETIHAEGLVMFTSKKWQTGRTIRFYFMDGPQWARDKVMEIGSRWLVQANLTFFLTNDRASADVRITFEPNGSWSYLGTDNLAIPKDEPTMQLGWLLDSDVVDDEDEWRRVVVHEFGHMLDFGHEHSSPVNDRKYNYDYIYNYFGGPPNYWSRSETDRQFFRRYSALETNFSEFDENSIMLYAIPPEFLLDPSQAVGWNTRRSKRDKRYAALWYGYTQTDTALDTLVASYDLLRRG